MASPRLLKSDDHAPERISRRALHEAAVAFAVEIFDRKSEGHAPVCVLAGGSRVAWFEVHWESDDEQWLMMETMRRLGREMNLHAYSFISQAYAVTEMMKVDEPLPPDWIPPSERPRSARDQILAILSFDKNGGHEMTRFLVTPRRQGPALLGPRVDEPVGGHAPDLLGAWL